MTQENILKNTLNLPQEKIGNKKAFDEFVSGLDISNLSKDDIKAVVGCLPKIFRGRLVKIVKEARKSKKREKKLNSSKKQFKGVVENFQKNNPSEKQRNYRIVGDQQAFKKLEKIGFSQEDINRVKNDIEILRHQNPNNIKGVNVGYKPEIGYTLKTNGAGHRLKFRTAFGYDTKNNIIYIYSIDKRDEDTYKKR